MRFPAAPRSWHALAALLASAAAIFMAAGCGDDDETKTLNVVSGTKGAHVATVDLGAEGKSPGDVYVFDNPLLDADGKKTLGRVYGTQTSIALTGDSEIVQAMITYDLGGGNKLTIGGTSQYPLGKTGLQQGQPFERPIIGGTGDYAGAGGTVTSVRRPDGGYDQTFDIED